MTWRRAPGEHPRTLYPVPGITEVHTADGWFKPPMASFASYLVELT